VACARCPYQTSFELLWRHDDDPDVVCVMLRCCAGPELQIRRGAQVLHSEIFKTVPAVRERADQLRGAPVESASERPADP
jgi:hypothetical protein